MPVLAGQDDSEVVVQLGRVGAYDNGRGQGAIGLALRRGQGLQRLAVASLGVAEAAERLARSGQVVGERGPLGLQRGGLAEVPNALLGAAQLSHEQPEQAARVGIVAVGNHGFQVGGLSLRDITGLLGLPTALQGCEGIGHRDHLPFLARAIWPR
jgi:hypothetical protein